MAELKPCPFCGVKIAGVRVRLPFHGEKCSFYVCCYGCGSRTALQIEEKYAIEAWNRRTAAPGRIDFDFGAED